MIERGQVAKLVPADSTDSNRFERVQRTAEKSVADPVSTAHVGQESDGALVSGRVIVAIPDAVARMSGSFERFTRQLLADAGLQNVRADDWYPQETLLALLEHLQETVGDQIVERLGRFLPELLPWPGTVTSLSDALDAVDDWYGTWNRSDTDAVSVSKLDDSQRSLSLDTPYPCRFERGLVRGLVHRFGSTVTRIRTTLYHSEPERGAVYHLTFGDRVPAQGRDGSPKFEDGQRLQH